MKNCIVTVVFASLMYLGVAKEIYIPSSFGGMDVTNPESQWSYQRSQQSDNFIIFWEKGYGLNPLLAPANYRVNISSLLATAEKSFRFYMDSLRFIHPGNSRTDQYKMIILLFYSTEWMASGSGVDDVIGQLNLSANAAQAAGHTLAHEVGHCFQYQVQCDGYTGGWRYGFGPNGTGGNGWWEQCAQWQAFKVYPHEQFSNYQFQNYVNWAHKNVWHEAPRYANYFIPDYWTYLHGLDIIGRLWQESQYPEDPVRAYKRITGITQSEFNDEMYDCAARFVTWDIPTLKDAGKNYIGQTSQASLLKQADGMWAIAPDQCIENYGYNVVRLNVPASNTTVKVHFKGMAGAKEYRAMYTGFAGWRYGIVALLKDGARIYSEVKRPEYSSTVGNPTDSLEFEVPANCHKLWLVVSGAPKLHWPHAWDDNDDNDEQWPYKVSFQQTNVYGEYEFDETEKAISTNQTHFITLTPVTANTNPYPSTRIHPNWERVCEAFKLSLSDIKALWGTRIRFGAVQPSGALNYTSTANAPGHWFNRAGGTTNWGNQSYIFSEFNTQSLSFQVGQYPGLCKLGDAFTIKQALVYTPENGVAVQALFEFRVQIGQEISTALTPIQQEKSASFISQVSEGVLYFTQILEAVQVYDLNGQVLLTAKKSRYLNVSTLRTGIYLITAQGQTIKVRIP